MPPRAHYRRHCGVWEPLRQVHRNLRAAQNHPHYVGNGKEHTLLADLLTREPPVGGLDAYLADMNRVSPPLPAVLTEIGERWAFGRLTSEGPNEYRDRLQLHLRTLALAIKDDLRLLDQLHQRPLTLSDPSAIAAVGTGQPPPRDGDSQ